MQVESSNTGLRPLSKLLFLLAGTWLVRHRRRQHTHGQSPTIVPLCRALKSLNELLLFTMICPNLMPVAVVPSPEN